jgi:hypothetical protein
MRQGRSTFVVVGVLAILAAMTAQAWGGDPPGNNGTVKVAGDPLDTSGSNNSHVGCSFAIQFFGYDEGPLSADFTLDLISPSGQGELVADSVFIGEDPAGGANDHDATYSADLNGPIVASGAVAGTQGFHVKLTVHADGSIGADTKHKTLWANGCGGEGEGGGEGGEG